MRAWRFDPSRTFIKGRMTGTKQTGKTESNMDMDDDKGDSM